MGTRVGIDPAFQGIGAVELIAGPELDGGQPQRQTLLRDDQAGMHQNSAHRVIARPAVIPSLLLAHHTDDFVLLAAVDEFRPVVKYQQRTADNGLEPLLRADKMPSQKLFFRDAVIRQKPIGCLRRRPVLASERDASTDLLESCPSNVRNLLPCRASSNRHPATSRSSQLPIPSSASPYAQSSRLTT
jgi:hypothetical protein